MNLVVIVGVCFVLLAIGTLFGRYYAPDRRPLRRAAEEGQAYARGLLEVLDGDDDAAIREISRAIERNTNTLEAYFALGALFRKRKEYERAVRVHQAILMRRDLRKPAKVRAYGQLAMDFELAGYPQRAVQAFKHVVAADKKQVKAFARLAQLFQQSGEWEEAAAAHRRVGKLLSTDTGALQAHLLAQHAHEAMQRGDVDLARKSLKRALSAAPESVHALHVLASYQEQKKQLDAAAKVWERALRLAPNLAAVVARRLERVLFELGQLDRFERILREVSAEHGGNVHVRLEHARFEGRHNPERALAELTSILDDAPMLVGARREAARLVLAQGDADAIRRSLEELVELLARADRAFRCTQCSHRATELFWQCGGCRAWGSVDVAWGRRQGEGSAPTALQRTAASGFSP